jgi:hypothetical protein
MKPRKAQYLMAHGRECLAVNRELPYHPNPKAKTKYATVAFLDSPDEPEGAQASKKLPRKKFPDPKDEIPWTLDLAVKLVCHELNNNLQQCSDDELEKFETELLPAIKECFAGERMERGQAEAES